MTDIKYFTLSRSLSTATCLFTWRWPHLAVEKSRDKIKYFLTSLVISVFLIMSSPLSALLLRLPSNSPTLVNMMNSNLKKKWKDFTLKGSMHLHIDLVNIFMNFVCIRTMWAIPFVRTSAFEAIFNFFYNRRVFWVLLEPCWSVTIRAVEANAKRSLPFLKA